MTDVHPHLHDESDEEDCILHRSWASGFMIKFNFMVHSVLRGLYAIENLYIGSESTEDLKQAKMVLPLNYTSIIIYFYHYCFENAVCTGHLFPD